MRSIGYVSLQTSRWTFVFKTLCFLKGKMMTIPVIDLFAGPGGLGEGFSSFKMSDLRPFEIKLSIEKNSFAYRTLQLRSFYRKFPDRIPDEYYDFLRNCHVSEDERRKILFSKFPEEAKAVERETRHAELGKEDPKNVYQWIHDALDGSATCVLIGGPPCQAYSLVGRSRNKGNEDYVPEKDERQYLYVEYLQIIADHRPAVFVMENVKGLLSATLKNGGIFQRICQDLRNPEEALKRDRRESRYPQSLRSSCSSRYKLFSLVKSGETDNLSEFVVQMEYYGIPQARHRVIILGIREDIACVTPRALSRELRVNACRVLNGLPHVRSGLSCEKDSDKAWRKRITQISHNAWFSELKNNGHANILSKIRRVRETIHIPRSGRGAEFVPDDDVRIDYNGEWFLDERLEGVCNHTARLHIVSDLHRYLFAACFARIEHRSPRLKDFPKNLLPDHENAEDAASQSSGLFADRFRVQLSNRPATTVTSHISKDGHYYIHHDPTQCRSLTVREAARLQTFPDNYFFCGARTSQYTQVGNAVPPLLARQVGGLVYDVLKQAGVSE